VWDWRKERAEGHMRQTMQHDPGALAARLLDVADVDAFIWMVWQRISRSSPLYDKRTAPTREDWTKRLLSVLRTRAAATIGSQSL
jgi:hypothetical protein